MLKKFVTALLVAGVFFVLGCAVISLADLGQATTLLAFKLWSLACLGLFAVAADDLIRRK